MAPRQNVKRTKKKQNCQSETSNLDADQQANPMGMDPRSSGDDHSARSAGHSSNSTLIETEEFNELNDSLQKRIVEALCTPEVIDVITKAVTNAIIETVTQRVYESLNHDIQVKLENMTKLEKDITDLKRKLEKASSDIRDHDLYSRRNCLRIHGIPESPDEKTDELVMKLSQEKLGVQLVPSDIDRSHRLTPRNAQSEGPRVLIVKFTRYNTRDQIYRARTELRGTKIFINEHLTKERQMLFNKVRESPKVKKAWTNDGRITAITKDDKKVKIINQHDIEKL